MELKVYADSLGKKNDLIMIAAKYTTQIDITDDAIIFKPADYTTLLELASGLYLYEEAKLKEAEAHGS